MGYIINWFLSHPYIALGIIATSCVFVWLIKCQKRLGWKWQTALSVAAFQAFAAIAICAKIMAIIETWDIHTDLNYRVYGPVFMMPLLYWLLAKMTKRKTADVFDVMVIALCINLILARVLCFLSGCCVGVLISETGTVRWPLRELEELFYVVFIIFNYKKVEKGKTHGEVYPLYLISYGVFRFLIEWLREEFTFKLGIFTIAHIWSMISVVIGCVLYYYVTKKKANIDHKSGKRRGKND